MMTIIERTLAGFHRPVREDGQAGQGYQFQVKINSRDTPQGLLIQPEVIPTQYSTPPPPGTSIHSEVTGRDLLKLTHTASTRQDHAQLSKCNKLRKL